MQTYILILIGILVLLLIGVVYFGWRKIINLEIESNKNKYDIEALRGLLSKLLDGDEIEMNPSFFKKEKPYNIQMNANELKNAQFGGDNEEESNVDTLHSSDDEEEIPEDESTVSIENIEDEDSDEEDDSDDDSDEDEDEDDDSDDSEDDDETEEDSDDTEEETENSEKDEKTESKDEEVKENESEPEPEVKEINLEKKEDKQETQKTQENDLEEESKTEIKVVDILNKNVKKFPSESLKTYKAGDVVVSKNDGNKYKVVMYKNQKRWKLIEE
jgi:hypothetical protein